MASRADLTPEEWEALQRLNRGPPESHLLPRTVFMRLADLGLAWERTGQRRLTDRGKQLIVNDKEGRAR